MIRHAIYIVIIGCALLGIDAAWRRSGRPFHVSKITSSLAYRAAWDVPQDCRLAQQILTQKFILWTSGSQTYAFLSEDGQYVLKCFKHHRWRPKTCLAYLPFPGNRFREDYLERERQRDEVFRSCATAFRELPEQTGSLFLHLNRTRGLRQRLTLVDKKGRAVVLELDHMTFVLQKRAAPLYPTIDACMARGDLLGAQQVIAAVFALLRDFERRGVTDNDPILRRNFGLIDGKAVQFDVSSLRIDPALAHRGDIRRITQSFRRWVGEHHPALAPYFDAQLAAF
jgi:hypothetical protein